MRKVLLLLFVLIGAVTIAAYAQNNTPKFPPPGPLTIPNGLIINNPNQLNGAADLEIKPDTKNAGASNIQLDNTNSYGGMDSYAYATGSGVGFYSAEVGGATSTSINCDSPDATLLEGAYPGHCYMSSATGYGNISLDAPMLVINNKPSAAPSAAPGAGRCAMFIVAGTNSGSCKLQMQCGTSATPVTVVDNVGSGC